MAPPPAPDMKIASADADTIECGICCLPLKPPIFQCDVGHVMCSRCRDRIEGSGANKCPHCRATMAGGFHRCLAMERVAEAVRAPCPNAAYGCDATPAYHAREEHLLACPHACHCPSEACGFVGSVAALLDHVFGATHNWPCKIAPSRRVPFCFRLRDGFNFVVTDDGGHGDKRVVLLNVTRHPFCRVVSVIGISPRAAAATKQVFFCISHGSRPCLHSFDDGAKMCTRFTKFRLPCSDLSDGIPYAKDCHLFVVPDKYVEHDGMITCYFMS